MESLWKEQRGMGGENRDREEGSGWRVYGGCGRCGLRE